MLSSSVDVEVEELKSGNIGVIFAISGLVLWIIIAFKTIRVEWFSKPRIVPPMEELLIDSYN
jgi:hypothetical protein